MQRRTSGIGQWWSELEGDATFLALVRSTTSERTFGPAWPSTFGCAWKTYHIGDISGWTRGRKDSIQELEII